MKRLFGWLKKVFSPPPGSSRFRKALPYTIIVVALFVIFLSGLLVWEETNTVDFCGKACHTMPPQFVTHQASSHTAITCEDCHLGRAPIFESIKRKAEYSWQTGSAMVLNTYKYPIIAHNMSPANEACLPCHNPDKFTSDKVMELSTYAQDEKNTLTRTFLIMKTRGGSKRTGLGFGIHWHNENPVYFYTTDPEQQNIPYIRMTTADGKTVEYIDSEVNFDPKSIDESKLQTMDCITCHNRTAHDILSPEEAVDQMMARNIISPTIPEIRKQAFVVLSASYKSQTEAMLGIDGLLPFYQSRFADFYNKNEEKIKATVAALKGYYQGAVFYDQKMDWETHPNNIGHKDSPGCFRCHDGKHITVQNEAIRLECNICHSIPVVSTSTELVTNIPVSQGVEPPSHKNVNWITLHRQVFDNTCEGCHTVEDPGGSTNTSFCSNSGCHGGAWAYAGFDAPNLREKLKGQLPSVITPTAAPTQPSAQVTPAPQGTPAQPPEKLVWGDVADLFLKCTACHKEGGSAGLDLTSYKGIMAGATSGAQIVPGDPGQSKLVQVQETGHFVKFEDAELAKIKQWIQAGALEK